jgi:hypothetical protein
VLVDFAQDALERLAVGDKVQIRACGLGLKLLDAPEVRVMNMDPDLLDAMGIEVKRGRVRVKVTHTVPAAVMGSGLGSADTLSGDYDIQLFDDKMVERHGLADLKLGDIVAVMDADNTYGRIFKSGAVSVGVVVHSCCVQAGHGPGLTTLLTSARGFVEPVCNARANIAGYLRIGTARSAPRKPKGRT